MLWEQIIIFWEKICLSLKQASGKLLKEHVAFAYFTAYNWHHTYAYRANPPHKQLNLISAVASSSSDCLGLVILKARSLHTISIASKWVYNEWEQRLLSISTGRPKTFTRIKQLPHHLNDNYPPINIQRKLRLQEDWTTLLALTRAIFYTLPSPARSV